MCRSAVRILMTKRPNILILNPDQRRGEVMSHLGNPAALTPNLDQAVAEDSVSFGKTFAQATVCTPSRCSFMTGWYPQNNAPHVVRSGGGRFAWWGGKNDLIPGQDGRDRDCDVAFQA
jgi:arylsulfatase A-like enzyme